MELQLISGRFEAKDAEQILTDIYNVKISFHQQKIRTHIDSEENIKHAEKRILQLEENLRNVIAKIKNSGKDRIDIHAHIDISFAPPLT